jgi:hypothetical protein
MIYGSLDSSHRDESNDSKIIPIGAIFVEIAFFVKFRVGSGRVPGSRVKIRSSIKTHRLAYVKWYRSVGNDRTRFHCRIEEEDYQSVNIELWKNDEFFDLSRDSIIPIHNIYSRFVPANFIIGKKRANSKTYMAVIPINRQFHL